MGRRGRHDDGPDGLVIVDKPAEWTSHDVVAKSRGLLGTRKVGHAGTLDPDATGVLLLGVGRATKLLRYLSPLGKSYVGEVVLGTETSTLDAAGEVTATFDMAGTSLDQVQAAAERFRGDISQVPPMVSALKVDGRRLHELAREGIEVERAPRPVTVHEISVEPGPPGEPLVFTLSARVSSGTYIRSLAADIGTALGGGAHLRNLRRTAVGPFPLADAVPLEQVSPEVVRPMIDVVRHLDSVVVDEAVAAAVGFGKVLPFDVIGVGEAAGPWAVVGPTGGLLAVYEPFRPGQAKPAVVLAPR